MNLRTSYQQDFQPPDADPFVEYGTVGHAGVDELVSVGTSGQDDENGPALVRVTLFSGRDITTRPKPGVADGDEIYCHVLGPLWHVPTRGKRVAVCWPEGRLGPGLILGTVGFNPTQQFSATTAVLDVGPDHALVLKGSCVTLLDHGPEEASPRFNVFLSVGRPPAGGDPGIVANDATGSGLVIAKGAVGLFATDAGSPPDAKVVMQLGGPSSPSPGYAISYKGMSLMAADSQGNLSIGCGKALALVGAQVSLGAAATALTPALVGLTGLTGIPSTSVFISI